MITHYIISLYSSIFFTIDNFLLFSVPYIEYIYIVCYILAIAFTDYIVT